MAKFPSWSTCFPQQTCLPAIKLPTLQMCCLVALLFSFNAVVAETRLLFGFDAIIAENYSQLPLLFGHLAEPSRRLARVQTPFPWPRVPQNAASRAFRAPSAGLSQAAAAPRCVLRATPAALSLGWLASESASSLELTSSSSSSLARSSDTLPPRALLASSTP